MGHILLADDHVFLLKALSILLSKEGYTFETAMNGQEAMQLYETGSFDAVITDLDMPIKTGLDVIRYIREDKSSSTPIIVLSAHSGDSKYVSEVEHAGASMYLSKGDSPLGIVNALHTLVERAS